MDGAGVRRNDRDAGFFAPAGAGAERMFADLPNFRDVSRGRTDGRAENAAQKAGKIRQKTAGEGPAGQDNKLTKNFTKGEARFLWNLCTK